MSGKNSCLVQSYRTIKTISTLCLQALICYFRFYSTVPTVYRLMLNSQSFKCQLSNKIPFLNTPEQVLSIGVNGYFWKIISVPEIVGRHFSLYHLLSSLQVLESIYLQLPQLLQCSNTLRKAEKCYNTYLHGSASYQR